MKRALYLLVLLGIIAGVLCAGIGVSSVLYTKKEVGETGESEKAHIIFGGDMLFDRYIRKVSIQNGAGYVFSCINTVLAGADLVVANLEGPITLEASVSLDSLPGGEGNYMFTHPPYTAELLKKHNIDVVNLANNHIWNFGKEGIEETLSILDSANVSYIGDPFVYRTERRIVGGVPLAFVAFTEFGGQSFEDVERVIQRSRAEGYVPVVYTHWGEEYVEATESERVWAHRFVDAGAALVIGSHPHVVQEYEEYQGVPIYYSLGNFIFDQYFTDEVRNGLLLRATFDIYGVVDVIEVPIHLEKDGRTCPVNTQ